MRSALNAIGWACVLLCIAALMAATMRPRTHDMASTLEVVVQPEASLQLEAQRQQARLAQAEIEADAAQVRADAWTIRLALILAALVLVAVAGAAIAWRRPRPHVVVLLPDHPDFYAHLRAAGGIRINGVPKLNGRVVDALEVWDE